MRLSGLTSTIMVLVMLLLPSTVDARDVHSWRDKDGNLHFSDSAPGSNTAADVKVVTIQDSNNYNDTTPATVATAPTIDAPAPLVMYSASWCGYCKKARRYFNANGIAFKELDIERDQRANRAYKKLGISGIPVIVQDGRTMRGFSVAKFSAFYSDARASN